MESLSVSGEKVKDAASHVAVASTAAKNDALEYAASALVDSSDTILAANEDDVRRAQSDGASASGLDRLRLDPRRLNAMADGLRSIVALADPVGEITDGWVRPNGLSIRRTRVPLGVIGIIYENRPNVTSDSAGLCIKSGNAAFLRGSSSALQSNRAIAAVLQQSLEKAGLPPAAVTLVEDTSRESVTEFIRMRGVLDCLVPRGGPGLISTILESATVPFILDGDGNCHVYVDAGADLEIATNIVVNAKTSRPSVCNAAESLVLHGDIAAEFLPKLEAAMPQVELVGDERACALGTRIAPAAEGDFGREFLALKMSVVVVDDLPSAIRHINRYGTGHTEAIVTQDVAAAARFTREVDAAVVTVNASTRFTDGGEFGFGAEIGNSTQKLHCRGPMGLRELTTLKYIVEGDGQIRT